MPRGGRREGAGRPVGALSKTALEIKGIAREFGKPAIMRLAALGGLLPAEFNAADSATTQVAALRELLDRGYGKATQPLSGDPDGPPLAVDFRWADALPATLAEPVIDADETISVTFVDTTNVGEC